VGTQLGNRPVNLASTLGRCHGSGTMPGFLQPLVARSSVAWLLLALAGTCAPAAEAFVQELPELCSGTARPCGDYPKDNLGRCPSNLGGLSIYTPAPKKVCGGRGGGSRGWHSAVRVGRPWNARHGVTTVWNSCFTRQHPNKIYLVLFYRQNRTFGPYVLGRAAGASRRPRAGRRAASGCGRGFRVCLGFRVGT
jgi:hypothetical protein